MARPVGGQLLHEGPRIEMGVDVDDHARSWLHRSSAVRA